MTGRRDPKRASGRVRAIVRAALVDAAAEAGGPVWSSQRAAARDLAARFGIGESTVRRALADETLAAAVAAAIEVRPNPVSHPGSHQGATTADGVNHDTNPHVDRSAAGSPADPRSNVSTSGPAALLSGPATVPPASPGRRPTTVRLSRFPGRCVLCLVELAVGHAFYLAPYDAATSVYCREHSALGLAMAQMFYDVTRGRPIAAELELYVGRPPHPSR